MRTNAWSADSRAAMFPSSDEIIDNVASLRAEVRKIATTKHTSDEEACALIEAALRRHEWVGAVSLDRWSEVRNATRASTCDSRAASHAAQSQ